MDWFLYDRDLRHEKVKSVTVLNKWDNWLPKENSDISAYTYERTLQAEQRRQMVSKMRLSRRASKFEVKTDWYFQYVYINLNQMIG